MIRSFVWWLPQIAVLLAMAACEQPIEADNEEQTMHQGQAVGADDQTDFAPAQELVPLEFGEGLHDPTPDSPPHEAPDAVTARDKLAHPLWQEMLAVKEAERDQEIARSSAEQVPPPTANPTAIAKQNRFFQLVRERQAEIDSLDPETRDEVYDRLKAKELGE